MLQLSCLLLILSLYMNRSFRLVSPLSALKKTPSKLASLKMSTSSEVRPRVLVPVADGSEEIETVSIIDTLVRGGCDVIVASVHESSLQVRCSRGVKLVADKFIHQCMDEDYDLIVCPGGMPGATNLRDSSHLTSLLQRQRESKKMYAAICAAPAVVLSTHGLLEGKEATCYPAAKFRDALPKLKDGNVIVSENVITSQGPGTALEFSLKLVELLFDKSKADSVAKEMLL
jgi:protein deglycase